MMLVQPYALLARKMPAINPNPMADPQSLGVSATAAASPQTITTTKDVPAGGLIVVFGHVNGTAQQFTAVSDNGGVNGAYTILDAPAASRGIHVAYIVNGASILPAGSVITVTYNGATSNRRCAAILITGNSAAPADTHNGAASSNGTTVLTTATVSTGALAQQFEIVLFLVGGGSSISSFNPGAGFTTLAFAGTAVWLQCGWLKSNGTGSISGTATWITPSAYGADIISFKAA